LTNPQPDRWQTCANLAAPDCHLIALAQTNRAVVVVALAVVVAEAQQS
jgi:hypothetical protein